MTWRGVRIALLTLLLALSAASTWLTRHYTAAWDRPLWVVVFPIDGDGSAASARSIDALSRDSFAPLETYLTEQARAAGLRRTVPFLIRLGPRIAARPPEAPFGGNVLQVMAWSLRLRWWTWRASAAYDGPPIDICLFVVYHDPALTPRLRHSLGLREGRTGIANVFADHRMNGSNQVVIAHELLHTVGATDKYDPATSLPAYPDGYAEPDREPRYPQPQAELMAGRRPVSATAAEIPESLDETRIGPATAREIGWSQQGVAR